MIIAHSKDDNHGSVQIKGNLADLLDEFVGIVRSMKNMLCEDFGAETADTVIALYGRLAYEENPEERDRLVECIQMLEIDSNKGE